MRRRDKVEAKIEHEVKLRARVEIKARWPYSSLFCSHPMDMMSRSRLGTRWVCTKCDAWADA